MRYDFFVSYSQKDKSFVDALVHYLEADAIRCWYAPRDIPPGVSWPAAITQAMKESGAMLLVFSKASNRSQEVAKEITLASTCQRAVIPIRIDDVLPNEEMQYHLSNRHWLDVFGLEMETAIRAIRDGLIQHVPARKDPDAETKTHDKAQARSSVTLSTEAPFPGKTIPKRPAVIAGGLLVLLLLFGGFALLAPSAPEKAAPVADAPPVSGSAATASRADAAPPPEARSAAPPQPDARSAPELDVAAELRRVRALLQAGKTAEALGIAERLAANGEAEAQNLLGDLYYSGSGVPVSFEKAAQWYAGAAEQDNAKAAYSLACLYYDGAGLPQSYAEAMRWFLRAAKRGDSAASFAIAEMYENGKGVNRSAASAYSWYLKAAEAGDPGAQYKVGVMLYEGNGIAKNREQGVRWLYQAAENGEPAAKEYMR